MATLKEQILTMEEKIKRLKIRDKHIDDRKKAIASKRERKADTRRKILIGAIVMAKVEQKVMDEKQLRRWLDEALSREDDRALFALSARVPSK